MEDADLDEHFTTGGVFIQTTHLCELGKMVLKLIPFCSGAGECNGRMKDVIRASQKRVAAYRWRFMRRPGQSLPQPIWDQHVRWSPENLCTRKMGTRPRHLRFDDFNMFWCTERLVEVWYGSFMVAFARKCANIRSRYRHFGCRCAMFPAKHPSNCLAELVS